ncbi:unnamed protein product [Lactuca saligna]|uniref:Uncharacterized protein n=1 Tax=Lactuca saligna TaxID=75948 RepID=A0AA35YEN5_LACSI|nr:unnamed protein product [Lactuca saligna]
MLVFNSIMVVMVVMRMNKILMMEVTMELVGIKTTTVVIGGIKAIGVETEITITGRTRISTMVAIITTMMGSKIKALGINTEGIQMVDSTMQMEDTTTKVINSIIFTFRNLIDNPWHLIFIQESMMMVHCTLHRRK